MIANDEECDCEKRDRGLLYVNIASSAFRDWEKQQEIMKQNRGKEETEVKKCTQWKKENNEERKEAARKKMWRWKLETENGIKKRKEDWDLSSFGVLG